MTLPISDLQVVVDPGSTHCGKREYAEELIRVASECKCDAIKFQLFRQREFPQNIELNRDLFITLIKYAAEQHIKIAASVFDQAALELLLNPKYVDDIAFIKFAYSRRNDVDQITQCLRIGRKVVVSTDVMGSFDFPDDPKLVKLFCEPIYPVTTRTNFEGMFPALFDGYSDHHLGWGTAVEAVEMGAMWIEKHITLPYTDCMRTPDGKIGLLPKDLDEFMARLRGMGRVRW
jgi:sialic acid synthase SpsE